MMITMEYDEEWVALIMRCVTSTTFSAIINLRPVGHIMPGCGIRQGSPLSPYLFLICSVGLSSLIHGAETNRHIHGIKVARSAPITSHLLLKYDCLIFAKANLMETTQLKQKFQVLQMCIRTEYKFSKI